ncbi:MAG: formyltetrahydrofolate deformylase [Spirochaetales bacterium]|nr:formyltetrahydrofolate deformylase [Spirochaetales bacterium]
MDRFVIKISCPDRKGIIAAVTQVMAECGANILDLTQHTASDAGTFMLKGEFEVPAPFEIQAFEDAIAPVANEFEMDWQLFNTKVKQKVAILVSKTDHCLWEILLKHRDGELDCDIPVVISNHLVNETVARQFGIPFYHVDYSVGKEAAEERMQTILKEYKINLVVMARFMQILSADFTRQWVNTVINIHHGFLPAFKGAKPYHQAWAKGVKLIGATAHFANEDLDQGPIIAQEILPISDKSSIRDLVQMGKDIERRTLLDALGLYLSHSIFVHKGRTFILR